MAALYALHAAYFSLMAVPMTFTDIAVAALAAGLAIAGFGMLFGRWWGFALEGALLSAAIAWTAWPHKPSEAEAYKIFRYPEVRLEQIALLVLVGLIAVLCFRRAWILVRTRRRLG